MDGQLGEVFVLWSAARAEANEAYDAWCDAPGHAAYTVYRAAEDRADAAETELATLTSGSLILAWPPKPRSEWQPVAPGVRS